MKKIAKRMKERAPQDGHAVGVIVHMPSKEKLLKFHTLHGSKFSIAQQKAFETLRDIHLLGKKSPKGPHGGRGHATGTHGHHMHPVKEAGHPFHPGNSINFLPHDHVLTHMCLAILFYEDSLQHTVLSMSRTFHRDSTSDFDQLLIKADAPDSIVKQVGALITLADEVSKDAPSPTPLAST
jgi:hypothetical protein